MTRCFLRLLRSAGLTVQILPLSRNQKGALLTKRPSSISSPSIFVGSLQPTSRPLWRFYSSFPQHLVPDANRRLALQAACSRSRWPRPPSSPLGRLRGWQSALLSTFLWPAYPASRVPHRMGPCHHIHRDR